jgi:hypothetical protein
VVVLAGLRVVVVLVDDLVEDGEELPEAPEPPEPALSPEAMIGTYVLYAGPAVGSRLNMSSASVSRPFPCVKFRRPYMYPTTDPQPTKARQSTRHCSP